MKKLAAPIVLLLTFAGCAGLPKAHVEADRSIYEAIEPDYRRYVEGDETLPPSVKGAKLRTLDLWLEMIEAYEQEVGR